MKAYPEGEGLAYIFRFRPISFKMLFCVCVLEQGSFISLVPHLSLRKMLQMTVMEQIKGNT